MATDYSKKTNAELVEILKSRSLPHTGKKAEMVARLQEDDKTKTEAAPAPAAKTDNAEDVIDWEDDEVPAADATEASTETAAATSVAASSNPNQQADTGAVTTDEPKVESQEAAEQETTEAAPVEEKPAVDYSIGLPITEMEEELKKRKARAEKFGITEDSQAAIDAAEKKLERAKRFGTGATATDAAEEKSSVGVSRLDEALPSEKSRKRGRGDNEHGPRGGKRRDFGGRNRGRRRGPGNRNPGGQGQKTGGNNNTSSGNAGMSEKDRLAMEARKKRFSTAA